MHAIDTNTQLCGVIGHPVGHSLSPTIHNAAYEALDLNYVYLAFDVTDLAGCLAGMRSLPNFRGASVTIPHKIDVMEHLDELGPWAKKVGSVNTITNDNGRLIGTSTDGTGAVRAMDEAGVSLVGKRVLFLGSGGAVRAVSFAVAELCNPGQIGVWGRTPDHVNTLVEDLRTKTSPTPAIAGLGGDLTGITEEYDVLIHGTPLGMGPNFEGQTCVHAETLHSDQVVFDMIYTPRRTQLVIDAETAGCTVIYGIDMLLNQAALQFERWTGETAPLSAMHSAVAPFVGEGS